MSSIVYHLSTTLIMVGKRIRSHGFDSPSVLDFFSTTRIAPEKAGSMFTVSVFSSSGVVSFIFTTFGNKPFLLLSAPYCRSFLARKRPGGKCSFPLRIRPIASGWTPFDHGTPRMDCDLYAFASAPCCLSIFHYKHFTSKQDLGFVHIGGGLFRRNCHESLPTNSTKATGSSTPKDLPIQFPNFTTFFADRDRIRIAFSPRTVVGGSLSLTFPCTT